MRISNFEQTGLDEVNAFLNKTKSDITLDKLKELMKSVNISFILEGITRLQSTLICELKDSYVQQSQRYVNMTNNGYNLSGIHPNITYMVNNLVEQTFDLYTRMTKLKDDCIQKGRPRKEDYQYGIPIEDGRYILHLAATTNVHLALSGDKFIDMLITMHSFKNYEYKFFMFDIINTLYKCLHDIGSDLPKYINIWTLRDEYDIDECISDFYQMNYFYKIDNKNKLVPFSSFKSPNLIVATGAITSTSDKYPSDVTKGWNDLDYTTGIIERITGYGHMGICEQTRHTFGIMLSLTAWHQQLRHRLPVVYRERFNDILQDDVRPVVIPETIQNSPFINEYIDVVNQIKLFRREYIDHNRLAMSSLLLNCDQVKVLISTNARIDEWILKERTCTNAHWEIRDLSIKKLIELRKSSNVLYEKALPPCVNGTCKEGAMTCGKSIQVKEFFNSLNK